MTITEMLGQSGLLTLLGMCVVFSFIIILIGCMKLLQIAVHAFGLDKEESKSTKAAPRPAAPAAQSPVADNKAVIAAIAACIKAKSV